MKMSISSVLWDVAPHTHAELPREFVVRRVLIYGTVQLIAETIRAEGIDYVRTVFARIKPTAFSQKRYTYLKDYL